VVAEAGFLEDAECLKVTDVPQEHTTLTMDDLRAALVRFLLFVLIVELLQAVYCCVTLLTCGRSMFRSLAQVRWCVQGRARTRQPSQALKCVLGWL
jgi:hypothetical protein